MNPGQLVHAPAPAPAVAAPVGGVGLPAPGGAPPIVGAAAPAYAPAPAVAAAAAPAPALITCAAGTVKMTPAGSYAVTHGTSRYVIDGIFDPKKYPATSILSFRITRPAVGARPGGVELDGGQQKSPAELAQEQADAVAQVELFAQAKATAQAKAKVTALTALADVNNKIQIIPSAYKHGRQRQGDSVVVGNYSNAQIAALIHSRDITNLTSVSYDAATGKYKVTVDLPHRVFGKPKECLFYEITPKASAASAATTAYDILVIHVGPGG